MIIINLFKEKHREFDYSKASLDQLISTMSDTPDTYMEVFVEASTECNRTYTYADGTNVYVNHSNLRVFRSDDDVCVGVAQRIGDTFRVII